MKLTVHSFLLLLGLCFSTAGNAQFIKKVEVETSFGASRVDLQMLRPTNPDFMNYLSQEDILIDAAHVGLQARFYLEHDWEITFLIERHVEFAPLLGNVHVTKKLTNNWGVNLGVGTESFIIGRIDEEYEHLNDQFIYETQYYYDHNPFDILSVMVCPFTGINYDQTIGRFNFRYTLNAGLSINQPLNRYLQFKEINSNYTLTDNYDIQSNASVFVKPELYACYKLIDNKNMVLGLRAKLTNYLTRKDLDYTRTHNEWTRQNPTIETIDQPKHWLNGVCFDLGLLYQRK